jgi:glycosyltransferase involved in cell wall biosynthesis
MSGGGPDVSVITIFLDAERFLAEAVESVLAQTYDAWELILVDDGSRDGSGAIARDYAARFPGRIRCVAHPGHANRGMSASRNLGLAHARGEFVCFLDADDTYLPEKLAHQTAVLRAHPEAAMTYGPTLHWHGWTGDAADAARDVPRTLGVAPDTVVAPPALGRLWLSRQGTPPGTISPLIRRGAALDVGGFEEEFRGMFEDQVFFYKIALEHPVHVSGRVVDRYRQHPGSTVRMAWARGGYWSHHPDPYYQRFLAWLGGWIDARGIADADLRAGLARERWWQQHRTALFVRRKLHNVARRLRAR